MFTLFLFILNYTNHSKTKAPPQRIGAFYPCLCLKRGFFLFMIYNFPLRRTILQSTLRFFMDALTFIQIQNSKVKNQNFIA